MKPGKKEKLKQKKVLFKAKHGYYRVGHRRAPKRHYYSSWNVGRDIRHYSKSHNIRILKDEDALFDIAKNAEHPINRVDAIQNHHLKDESKLLELINGNYGYDVRIAAVRRIRSDETLIDLLKNHNDWHVRYAALDSIKKIDETILNDVALNDEDYVVRRKAAEHVKNQDVLVYISRNDEDALVRANALEKIRNMDIIVFQAKNDPNWRVRKAAIELIDDIDVLEQLLENEKDMFIQEFIEEKIEKFKSGMKIG